MAVTNLMGAPVAGVISWTGEGAPESFVTGAIGDTYADRTAGGHYVKVTGAVTNTGWIKAHVGVQTVQVSMLVLCAGALTAAANKARITAPVAGSIVGVYISAITAPVGAAILVDLNKAGTTMFTTQANRPTIADGANDGAVKVPDIVAVAAGDVLTVDVDQVGSGTAGSNLTVSIALRVSTE